MPGMGHDAKWWREYEALRRAGKSKTSAAKITNATQSKGKKSGKRGPVQRKRGHR